jgi:hypothetical protein
VAPPFHTPPPFLYALGPGVDASCQPLSQRGKIEDCIAQSGVILKLWALLIIRLNQNLRLQKMQQLTIAGSATKYRRHSTTRAPVPRMIR